MKITNYLKNQHSTCWVFVLIILTYFTLFHKLGEAPIYIWDEATYANNSIDMAFEQQNIFIVQHLNNEDLYNTKPPFVIWMQAISIKLFGINEFAVRIPSALFSTFTIFLVFFFCKKHFKSINIAFISSVVLLSSEGYVVWHVARSGDLDAILVFWLTLGLFTFIDLIILRPKNTTKHYVVLSAAIVFGFLTKGIAAYFFIPFMFIISLFNSNRQVFKDKALYYSIFIVLFLCLGYYWIRELYGPGYLDLVFGSEILRFNKEVMSWHVQPFNYYYLNLKNKHFTSFFKLIPVLFIAPFFLKSTKKKSAFYLLFVVTGFFLLISYPPTKLGWYDAPMFPILSVLIGLTFFELMSLIFKKIGLKNSLSKSIIVLMALLFLYDPYTNVLKSFEYNDNNIYSMNFDGAFLKYLNSKKAPINKLVVFKKEKEIEHFDQVLFYIRRYNIENQFQIKLSSSLNFEKGDLVMCSKNKQEVSQKYNVETVEVWKQGVVYKI